jgi:hypothetical protein
MRTTTKRALSTFLYFMPLAIVRMAGLLLGILWSVISAGFRDGCKVDREIADLWDPKNNDPEYRHESVAHKR